MVKTKSARIGVILSAIWFLGGGYWRYYENSYAHRITAWHASEICDTQQHSLCEYFRSLILPIAWSRMAIELALGFALIWGGILVYRWVTKPS